MSSGRLLRADHWAYDAVAQLADDGIIEGYGDGTYRGQNEITRYEMAQMVAKAMAKEDQANAQQKAMIDRLAAEFSEELNNLGVRVANLEDRIDNVKWTGELRYTYERTSGDFLDKYEGGTKTNNELLFRLEPEATINDHWKVKARLDATWNPSEDKGKDGDGNKLSLEQAYAEGTYGKTVIRGGKMPIFTEQGIVIDDDISGASVTLSEGAQFSGTLFAGRWDFAKAGGVGDEVKETQEKIHPFTGQPWLPSDVTAHMQLVNLNRDPSEKFHVGAEYIRIKEAKTLYGMLQMEKARKIQGVGATWKPADTMYLSGGYWKNISDKGPLVSADYMKAYNIELGYRGAEPENPRSFGFYAAYRYVGGTVAFAPTFDDAMWDTKGWEIGGNYTFAKNIVGTLIYFDGKDLEKTSDDGVKKLFTRLEYFF